MRGISSFNTCHENRAASIDACRYLPFEELGIDKARTKVELCGPYLLTSKCSNKSRLVLAIMSLGLLVPLRAALAQQADDLAEVIVTATKRESIAQNTPMSITVIGPDVLRTNQIDDFADFAFLVPGLTSTDTGPGNKRYALRGLQSPGEPEVALYYDEIPISGLPGGSLDTGASQPDLKLWDVDRIEVLRGPEGTLYGNGSEGGAIRIISKRPDLTKLEGTLQAVGSMTDGGAGSYSTNLMVNLPIIGGKFAVRAIFYDRDEGGYIDAIPRADIRLPQLDQHNINDERTRGARASVSFQVADNWNLAAIMYYQRLLTGSSFETYPSYATPGDPYVSAAFVQTPWLDESHMYNVISQTDLPWASVFVTGSYQLRTVSNNLDTTRYLLSLFGCGVTTWDKTCFGPPIVPADSASLESVSAWSGEARLVSNRPGRFQWTLGFALQNAKTYRYGQVASVNVDGNIEYDPSTGDAQERLFARQNRDVFDQYSFFGNASYEVLEGLKADAGLRWFHSYRTDQQIIVQQFFPRQPTGPEPFQEFGQRVLFKSFELSYALGGDVLTYVQAAQGFRAGGPNYPGGFTLTAPPYKADSVWDYEIGTKLGFFGNRLHWNSAVFDIEWSNLQVLLPTALFSYISNAGSARSDGFESELDAQLSRHFNLAAGLTYTDARLVGAQPLSSVPASQLRAGDQLAGVPEWTGTLGLAYNGSLGTRYTIMGRLDTSYQSGRSSVVAPQNPAYFRTKGYALTNFHLNLDRTDGWGASLDIDNLFSKFAELSVQAEDSNLIETVTPERPLTISVGLIKRF
jgi:outer membrane receptor protein involved in Fe transport